MYKCHLNELVPQEYNASLRMKPFTVTGASSSLIHDDRVLLNYKINPVQGPGSTGSRGLC